MMSDVGPTYHPLWLSQRPSEGVFQPTQHIHDVVKRSDDLRLLRQVEREVPQVRRILLQPSTRSDAAR